MDGCGIETTYTTWHNNKCYAFSSFYIQSSYDKYYNTNPSETHHDPGYLQAEKDAKATMANITHLTEKIISTFQFTQ